MTPKQFERHIQALKDMGARRVRVSTPTTQWDVSFDEPRDEPTTAIGFMVPPEQEETEE